MGALSFVAVMFSVTLLIAFFPALSLVAEFDHRYYPLFPGQNLDWDFIIFFFADGLSVLILALMMASLFSIRYARKKGFPVWNKVAWNLVWNMMIPLAAGGLFCLIQVYHGSVIWISSTTLIFYGLALLNIRLNMNYVNEENRMILKLKSLHHKRSNY